MQKGLCLIGIMLLVGAASARQMAGVEVPEQITLVEGQVLRLNGAGVRRKFFLKVYVGALYVPSVVNAASAVLAQDGPRQVMMHVLYSELSRDKLVDGWKAGFEANLSPTAFAELQPRIRQFNALFESVAEGDVMQLTYLPGQGTTVVIRGEAKGVIAGKDFNDALLRIWLGEHPADDGLKEAMLGAEE